MSDDEKLPGEEEQPNLLSEEDLDADWKATWKGMPSYDHEDLQPDSTLLVHFKTARDRAAFAQLIGQALGSKTKFVWHPKAEIGTAADKVWSGQKVTPRHPIYIISKGRWESRLTSKALEWIGVPYHIVIEPQEFEKYAAVIPREKILVTPFSNLGQGGIPARNFVWEHSVAVGAARHWILDDNISGFCRFQDNLKVELDNASTFCAIEDWVDRYENVMMAGFNYDYFAPRKQGAKIKPITFNTRIYSGILLDNRLAHRWRGRYNEDTDLSLRILKDGWCTALFNAFLMYKKPTLTMKGGNTDELYAGAEEMTAAWEKHAASCRYCGACTDGYGSNEHPCNEGCAILAKDGRWLMAESLREQHPDLTTVERKWRRWQHQVDYRRFQPALGFNVLKLKEGIVISDESEYELTMDAMPAGESGHNWQGHVEGTRTISVAPGPAAPSALDFLRSEQPALQASPDSIEKARPEEPEPALAEPGQPSLAPEAVRGEPESEPEAIPFDALFFKGYLAVKGHRLLTRDGKFFVSEAHTLTDVERATIKTHRDELIALAEPWNPIGSGLVDRVVNELEKHVALHLSAERSDDGLSGQGVEQQATGASLFEDPPTQTLAQFLNDAPIRIDINFVPDEPPDLTDINEVVLNFATDGLDWAGNALAVGVTVGTLDGKLTRFLPFAFKGGGNLDQAVIERWGKEQLQGKKIYNANMRFDMHIGRKLKGFDLEAQGCTFTDIMHTAALLDDHRKQFRLDKLAEDYLPGLEKVSRVDESQHSHYHASEVAEREKFTAELVWRLKNVMYPQLVEQELMDVQHLEDDVIPAVVEMEENGSPLDVALLDEYHAEASKRHDALLWEVAKECGFAFDHTAKSWQRLFESLGLPPTDGNNEAIVGAIDHPTVKKAHLAAQYASLDSKTFKAYKDKIGPDGILRFDINQLRGDDGGTVSGRFSIGYVQQVPNHDNHFAVFGEDLFPRRLYVCGKDELDYLEADAMQIEQRLLVHYMNNPKIIKEYEGDYDRLMRGEETVSFHKVTWAMLKEYKPDMLYSHQKSFNFAKQYGARSIKLASMMGFISAAEGDEIRTAKRWNDPRLNTIHEIEAAYKKMVPEGDDLLEMASHLAKVECDQYCKRGDKFHRMYQHRGYVKTLVGRRSRFPTNYKTYIGLNRVLQGTGADLMKKKLAELHRARKYTGLVLRLTVHDAAGGGTTLPETKQRVSEVLNAQSYQLKVPILWSTNTGKNWAACK